MKKFIKLIPALAMLLIATTLVSTATFAWFSMNNQVTVTGMTISTKVNDNLFIATSSAGTSKVADSEFKNATHQTTAAAQLQPVSTIDGANFFYTYDATAEGSKMSPVASIAYDALSGNDIEINSTHYKGYTDYVFELKAINSASSADKYLNLTGINLLYMGEATNVTKAFRIAVFTQAQDDPDTLPAQAATASIYKAMPAAADKIFEASGATYFTTNSGVKNATTLDAVGNLVDPTSGTGWTYKVDAGKTVYYKVTVRLWLEGEDKDCYNTKFVDLTKEWDLDLTFALEANQTNVKKAINSTVVATAAVTTGKTVGVTLSSGNIDNGEKAASYAWYNAETLTAIAGATGQTYTNTGAADVDVYCLVTTIKGNVYRTNVITAEKPE